MELLLCQHVFEWLHARLLRAGAFELRLLRFRWTRNASVGSKGVFWKFEPLLIWVGWKKPCVPLKSMVEMPNRRRFDRYLACAPICKPCNTRQVAYVECILRILAELQTSMFKITGQSSDYMCGGAPLVSFFRFRIFLILWLTLSLDADVLFPFASCIWWK